MITYAIDPENEEMSEEALRALAKEEGVEDDDINEVIFGLEDKGIIVLVFDSEYE